MPAFSVILIACGFFLMVGVLFGFITVAVYRVMQRTPAGVRFFHRRQNRLPLLHEWSAVPAFKSVPADSSSIQTASQEPPCSS